MVKIPSGLVICCSPLNLPIVSFFISFIIMGEKATLIKLPRLDKNSLLSKASVNTGFGPVIRLREVSPNASFVCLSLNDEL